MKVIKWGFAILMITILSYLIIGQMVLPEDGPDNGYRCEEFISEWNMVDGDGNRIPVEIPGKCEVERGEEAVIETVLPEKIDFDTYLCVRSGRQDMKLYVDGQLRETYSTQETRLFGRASAVAYIFLGLEPEDAGKLIRIESKSNSAYSGIFYTMYLGNKMGIWYHMFENYGTELLVAFLTMVLSIVSILGSLALRVRYKKRIELEYLGWGIFLAAVWLITNSMFRQLIFPNLSSVSDTSFFVIMLVPIPVMIYMNAMQKDRYKRIYEVLSGALMSVLLICATLHMLKIKDFDDSFTYMAIVCMGAILTIITLLIVDIFRGYIKEYVFVALGILSAVLASAVQIILYFQKTSFFTGVVLAIGLIALLVFAVFNTVRDIMQMEGDKQKALEGSASKGRFLANMSHEIRTPINAVLGMDAMILRESKEQHIREYALDIQNAGQSLLALINDILDFSKIESGKMELIPVEYDVSSMIHDIVSMISMKAEVKELQVNLSVDESLPSRLYGDDVRIRQVLVNLLNNAVKYTEEGSVSLSVKGETNGDTAVLRFEVEDTGIGIKEEDIEKLTKAFERIEEQRNRNVEGTGLGMSITVQLLELMGSHLEVESVYGKGSRFFFELKQGIVDEEPIGDLEERIRKQATEYEHAVTFIAPEAKVLVVDDNAVNRKVFVKLLKETEVDIDEAASGEESLLKISEKKYDIIFLDHMMPEMDGVETLHQMRENYIQYCEGIPVVALTANAIAGAREMYLEEGFDNYLSKPINPDKLEMMLKDYLPKDKLVFVERKIQKEELAELSEEKFPYVEGIEWEYAMMHMRDEDLLFQTVCEFYEMIDAEADALALYFDQVMEKQDTAEYEEALRQYRIKAHTMKGSAALIGAVSLSGVARILEYAARDGKRETIGKVTSLFLEEWRSFKEKLVQFSQQDDVAEEEKLEVNYWMLQECLRLLENAMDEMDIDTSDEIVKQLKMYDLPEEMQDTMDKIFVAVMNLDGNMVKEHAEIIREQIEKQEE